MFPIIFFIVLSTMIGSIDCCMSRSLCRRKPLTLYPVVELSVQKPALFSKTDLPESLPPRQDIKEISTTPAHRRHHLHYDNGEGPAEDDESLKSNRSQRSDLQNEEDDLMDELQESYTPKDDRSMDSSGDIHFVDDRTTVSHLYPGDNSEEFRNQTEETQKTNHSLEQKLENTFFHENNDDEKADSSKNEPTGDAQYKTMSEILSIECGDWLRLEFCLNGGRCFLYPILNQSLLSCECADGYVGERCEAKSFDFIPLIRPRFVLAKTIGGPLVFGLALIDILFLLFLFCKNCNRD